MAPKDDMLESICKNIALFNQDTVQWRVRRQERSATFRVQDFFFCFCFFVNFYWPQSRHDLFFLSRLEREEEGVPTISCDISRKETFC